MSERKVWKEGGCEEQRKEKGSGIGKRHEEGGTNVESAIWERWRQRWKKWEGVKLRGKYSGSFLAKILFLCLSAAFPSLEKPSLFPLSFLPPFSSFHSSLSLTSCVSSLFLVLPSLTFYQSPCFNALFLRPSTSHTFWPCLHPSFHGLHFLLSFLFTSFLPGCISSRRASPKRYWDRDRELKQSFGFVWCRFAMLLFPENLRIFGFWRWICSLLWVSARGKFRITDSLFIGGVMIQCLQTLSRDFSFRNLLTTFLSVPWFCYWCVLIFIMMTAH